MKTAIIYIMSVKDENVLNDILHKYSAILISISNRNKRVTATGNIATLLNMSLELGYYQVHCVCESVKDYNPNAK